MILMCLFAAKPLDVFVETYMDLEQVRSYINRQKVGICEVAYSIPVSFRNNTYTIR